MENYQGAILKYLVDQSGMSVADAASQMGLNPSYLSKIFSTESLSSKVINAACRLFGVNEDVFDKILVTSLVDPDTSVTVDFEVKKVDVDARHVSDQPDPHYGSTNEVIKTLKEEVAYYRRLNESLVKIIGEKTTSQ